MPSNNSSYRMMPPVLVTALFAASLGGAAVAGEPAAIAGRAVVIEVRLVEIGDDASQPNDAASEKVQTAKLLVKDGTSGSVSIGKARIFKSRITVANDKGPAVIRPEDISVFEGIQLEASASILPDGKRVRVTVKGSFSSVLSVETVQVPVFLRKGDKLTRRVYPLERPAVHTAAIDTAVIVPNKGAALVHGTMYDKKLDLPKKKVRIKHNAVVSISVEIVAPGDEKEGKL